MAEILNASFGESEVDIIYEGNSRLPLVSMQLIFEGAGALGCNKAGLAKISSRLLGEGTLELGSESFSKELESKAVSLSASVGNETLVITLSSLKSEFTFALSMLHKLILDPNYSKNAFEKVQAQLIGALTHKQSDFDYIASNGLKSLLFEGTAKEYPNDGTIEAISSITLDETRSYIHSSVGRDNLIVVAGGDISKSEAKSAVVELMRLLKVVDLSPVSHMDVRKEPKEIIDRVDTEQAYLYFGSPYYLSYDSEDRYLAKIASFVLGSSGFGSRLMEEIRVKRGLAYSVYANLSIDKNSSYFTGYLQTKTESSHEAQEVVSELVERFVKSGITADELQSAKDFLLGSEPLRRETLQQRLGIAFNDYYSGQGLDYSAKELDGIKDATLDKVNDFIVSHPEMKELSFYIVTK